MIFSSIYIVSKKYNQWDKKGKFYVNEGIVLNNYLTGKEVAQAIKEECKLRIQGLQKEHVVPKLAILRLGDRADDINYENSILKNADSLGIICQRVVLPESCLQKELEDVLDRLSSDQNIHGILLFCPLPKQIDTKKALHHLQPKKDIDGLTYGNYAHVYAGDKEGFAPCTPSAVIALLDFYNISVAGKNILIIGRSLVVGKPLAMLLLEKNATVTIAHSKTEHLIDLCQRADILCAAIGRANFIDESFVREGQIIIDIGVNQDPDKENAVCGDVNLAKVQDKVAKITPVPRGVGSVTTSILLRNTIIAAERMLAKEKEKV